MHIDTMYVIITVETGWRTVSSFPRYNVCVTTRSPQAVITSFGTAKPTNEGRTETTKLSYHRMVRFLKVSTFEVVVTTHTVLTVASSPVLETLSRRCTNGHTRTDTVKTVTSVSVSAKQSGYCVLSHSTT